MELDKQYVVFKTPTTLDMRAITTFGLNAKPNSKSPIGYFGTGLKMAIAVLLRNNVPIRLFIGDVEYEFLQGLDDFRGTEYTKIGMRKRSGLLKSWSYVDLPFTTALAKNWHLWQAFRELESNTRDEAGSSSVHSDQDVLQQHPEHKYTTFIIGPSPEFASVYAKRDDVFLPEALQRWEYGDEKIQVFRAPSKHIYYRGIRVHDLDKVSMFTYNILQPMDLTEDRTLKYEWAGKNVIQEWLAQSEDVPLINQLLNATDDHYESKLEWDDVFSPVASAVFRDTLARRVHAKKGSPLLPRFTSYHQHLNPPPQVLKVKVSEKLKVWRDNANKSYRFNETEISDLDAIITELEESDN